MNKKAVGFDSFFIYGSKQSRLNQQAALLA
jgi:hypothetical protein